MFLKIFKYDFLDLIKKMAIFYIVIIATATYALIMDIIFGATKYSIIATIPTTLYYIMIPAGFVVPVILCMIRYYRSMLSDEGYLTHTLPVRKSTLLLSKLAVTFVIILISIIVVVLAMVIYTRGDVVSTIGDILFIFFGDIDNKDLGPLLLLGTATLLIIGISTVMMVTTCLTLGGMHNKNKLVMAFVYYVIYSVISNILSSVITFIVMGITNGISFDTTESLIAFFYLVLLVAIGYYVVLCLAFYFISLFVLKRKINLN